MKPLLVDFFCCEGGAAMGYAQAGFRVIGVDCKPQPRYPFEFVQASIEDPICEELAAEADALHGSPSCQFGSELTPVDKRANHINWIPTTRALFRKSGKPYVIENVRAVREHLIEPVSLFGTMFGNHMRTSVGRLYMLSRERLFETNWGLTAPHDPGSRGHPIVNVYGGHLRCRDTEHRTEGGGRSVDFPGEDRPALARQLMEMPWASMTGMSEAVPPSYTRWIGEQLLAHLAERRVA